MKSQLLLLVLVLINTGVSAQQISEEQARDRGRPQRKGIYIHKGRKVFVSGQ